MRFKRQLTLAISIAAVLCLSTSQSSAAELSAQTTDVLSASKSLAPNGHLRVAINLGNTVLAQKDKNGQLEGVSVRLAHELASRLNLPLELKPYESAGQAFSALDRGEWDVAFLADEPKRADKLDFSTPYVYLEGTYLVNTKSPYEKVSDLDKSGLRIAVGEGAAYDLYLTSSLKNAQLIRAQTSAAAVDLFQSSNLDAAAGVRQYLDLRARQNQGLRVLADSYTRINQAIAIPKGRTAGANYINKFIQEMKSSGRIREELNATGQQDAKIAN